MSIDLAGSSVVVTGGAQGLGLAIVRQVHGLGARVAVVDRDGSKLEAVASELPDVTVFNCDISDPAQVRKTVGALSRSTVDIVISNAGLWTDNEIDGQEPSRKHDVFATNAAGNIDFLEAFLPHLRSQDRAHLFNVISTAGDQLSPSGDNREWRSYGASKMAWAGYTKSLRDSLQQTKIKVTGFFPGGIDTNLYENAGRSDAHGQFWMMSANDMADIIVFMLTRPRDVLIESLTVVKAEIHAP